MRRLRGCGRYLTGETAAIVVKAGSAYWTGLVTCGSIWVCPVCAAKIRQRRAVEIEGACLTHLEAGGSVGFLTVTFPHSRDDDLASMLTTMLACWKAVQQGKPYRSRKTSLGLFGFIRATEVTYGRWNGWHPHLHLLLFAEGQVTTEQWVELRNAISKSWAAAVVKHGRDRPGEEVGVTLAPVRSSEVGAYLAKVQDHYGNESKVGREMARGDVKKGRKQSRTPFELAESAVEGLVPELPLWHEFEKATKGRRAIEWSRGLKARFAVEDLADEDLAAVDEQGTVLVRDIDRTTWGLVVGDGAEAHVLDLAEEGGAPAVHEFLLRLRQQANPEDED